MNLKTIHGSGTSVGGNHAQQFFAQPLYTLFVLEHMVRYNRCGRINGPLNVLMMFIVIFIQLGQFYFENTRHRQL